MKQITLSIFIAALIIFTSSAVFGQGVGINNPTPNASSILDITSTNKGLLVPRMTTAQRVAISTPATGLLVYDTSLNLFYYFDGTAWRPFMIGNLDWLLAGNAGTSPATNFVGTTDAQPLVFRTNNVELMRLTATGNVGIGTTAPNSTALLELNSNSKGILIPRMTSVERVAIVTPATGLLVYDTTVKLFYYFDGTQWVPLQSNLGWLLTGNAGTSSATNYLGTIDAQHLVIKTNSLEAIRILSGNQFVGVGLTVPGSRLSVNGNFAVGASYSSFAAPVNGAIIQGHTSIGSSGPLAIDVLSSYATGSEVAVAGYSTGTNFAAYFQNNSTGTAGRFYKVTGSGGSALQAYTNSAANNANVVEIAGNGTGNSLNISDTGTVGKSININKISTTTTGSAIEVANAGKGIGLYLKNTNATNTNPGIKVEQTKGDGTYIQMQSGNTGTGFYVYHNGTGLGSRLDMAATNPSIGFQINHAGTERGIDINMTNAANAADAIKIIHSGTGKGINVSVASTASYAIWATNAGTVPAVNPSYVVSIPTSYTTSFAPGVAVIAAGGGHGIIANSVLDASSTTDHDGGIFVVRQDNLTSTNVAAASVGARINNTTYKIIGLGAVSTLVKDLNDEMRVMACPESPEVLFQDFGRGKLNNGTAHISLDPIFSKNIKVDATHPLSVFIQLRGDCKGVYVTNESQTGFDVVELNGGNSNVEFTYFVSASRANETLGGQVSEYENMRFKKFDNPMFNQREK